MEGVQKEQRYSFNNFYARLQNLEYLLTFVMSLRPSVQVEQLGFHWTDFHEVWYLNIFRKSAKKKYTI
jgi:hypothetical protein